MGSQGLLTCSVHPGKKCAKFSLWCSMGLEYLHYLHMYPLKTIYLSQMQVYIYIYTYQSYGLLWVLKCLEILFSFSWLTESRFRTRPGGWGCTKLKVLGGIVCAIMYAIVRCVHTLLRGTWRHSRSSHWYRSDACAPGTCYTVARSLWSLTGSRHTASSLWSLSGFRYTARSLWSLSGFRYTARSSFWSLLGLCHTIVRSLWSLSGFRYTARSSFWSLLGLSEKKKKIYIYILGLEIPKK